MREIKFRGLNRKFRTWAYGHYCRIGDKHYIIERDVELTDVQNPCPEHGVNGFTEIVPKTHGQSTGIKDKHGKDSYFQDISKDDDGDKYIVNWDENEGRYYLRGLGLNCLGTLTEDLALSAIKEQEVIGNKWEKLC